MFVAFDVNSLNTLSSCFNPCKSDKATVVVRSSVALLERRVYSLSHAVVAAMVASTCAVGADNEGLRVVSRCCATGILRCRTNLKSNPF